MSIYDDINAGKYENTMTPYAGDAERVRAWKVESRRLESLFRDDLFAYLEIEDHPKRHVLYRIAWDKGHSGGYSDVVSEAFDLVDLIREES